jgi:putative glutamine amidotransferase
MSRPLIAISAGMEELPTAFGVRDCTKLNAEYTGAVYAAGGQPVILPVVEEPPTSLLARMDGLLLTGGGDLDPALYGQPPDPSVYGVHRDRDTFETALYREAVALSLPVLALCRGMQLINVLRGGTLVQQIPGHWQENPATGASHEIDVTAGTALAETFGAAPVAWVNSYHHQGLGELGEGLRVTAVCGDVIEALEALDADVVAVQWHPEHMAATDQQQRALFEAFVKRAAAAVRSRTDEEMTL